MRVLSRLSFIGRAVLSTALIVGTQAAPAAAQNESALRDYFEGRRVTVTLDMPGTSDGVDVQADSGRPINFREHGDRLKEFGIAIRADERATITLVKVKGDVIEVQLDGGGFGTLTDDSSTSVSIPLVAKSEREKSLERAVKDEDDPRRRRDLARELDELHTRRETENRRIEALRINAEERRKTRVREQRLNGGSRFNLRYQRGVPRGITPEALMTALADYVQFSDGPRVDGRPDRRLSLRRGMSIDEVERVFGDPESTEEHREGRLTVVTLVFMSRGQRLRADFVNDVLVDFETRGR